MIATLDHGSVRELRLNRPPVNALSPELIASLLEAIRTAPHEGKRALVLSGLPGIFSAGLDVPQLLKLDRLAMDALWREFYALIGALACSPVPIAAAITAHAPAGGTVLALFCDHRIAAEGDWRIGLSEVQECRWDFSSHRSFWPRYADSSVRAMPSAWQGADSSYHRPKPRPVVL
jgi:Delta3-Delta2-enoyl-CoA isomerase